MQGLIPGKINYTPLLAPQGGWRRGLGTRGALLQFTVRVSGGTLPPVPKVDKVRSPWGLHPVPRLRLTCPCMSPGAQGARKQGCVAALSAALPAAHPPACPGRLCPVYSQDEPCTELGSQDQGPSRCPGPEASPRSPSAGGPRVPLVDKDTAAPRR